MTKGTKILFSLFLIGLMFTSGCTNSNKSGENTNEITPTVNDEMEYKDGKYEVKTDNDLEGYVCEATVTIKENKITNVEWTIYDITGRVFDEKYEEIYAGSPEYQQQCRDNLAGAETYGPKLIEFQDIDKVDAISGATWSYLQFQKAIRLALEKAKM